MHDITNNTHDDNIFDFDQQRQIRSKAQVETADLSDHVARIKKALVEMYAAEACVNNKGYEHLWTIKVSGDELSEAKSKFDYGELGPEGKWGSWLETHFDLSMSSANDYMAVAGGWGVIVAKFYSTAAKPSLRWALGIIRQKKPRTKKDAVNNPAAPYSPEALQKLSASERAQLSANLPNEIKVEIVAHAVAQTQRTTDKHETENRDLAWECVGAISKILATKARPECKIEDIKDALNNILKRTLPVMDHEASYH